LVSRVVDKAYLLINSLRIFKASDINIAVYLLRIRYKGDIARNCTVGGFLDLFLF